MSQIGELDQCAQGSVDSGRSCIAARKQAVIERSCKVKSEILRAEILRPRWQHNRWM
ncbi:MAG: hypothetical protein QOI59_4422 [Gammaproteobacteria bacterium]|nr:hypothetical protein [Gammaproteobacteria bacterium]